MRVSDTSRKLQQFIVGDKAEQKRQITARVEQMLGEGLETWASNISRERDQIIVPYCERCRAAW